MKIENPPKLADRTTDSCCRTVGWKYPCRTVPRICLHSDLLQILFCMYFMIFPSYSYFSFQMEITQIVASILVSTWWGRLCWKEDYLNGAAVCRNPPAPQSSAPMPTVAHNTSGLLLQTTCWLTMQRPAQQRCSNLGTILWTWRKISQQIWNK